MHYIPSNYILIFKNVPEFFIINLKTRYTFSKKVHLFIIIVISTSQFKPSHSKERRRKIRKEILNESVMIAFESEYTFFKMWRNLQ